MKHTRMHPATTGIVLALCLAASSARSQDGTLLVVNRHSLAGSVSFFDLETEASLTVAAEQAMA